MQDPRPTLTRYICSIGAAPRFLEPALRALLALLALNHASDLVV